VCEQERGKERKFSDRVPGIATFQIHVKSTESGQTLTSGTFLELLKIPEKKLPPLLDTLHPQKKSAPPLWKAIQKGELAFCSFFSPFPF
jgi:hypothetical protein